MRATLTDMSAGAEPDPPTRASGLRAGEAMNEPTVTMSVRRHAELMRELEDLRDRVSVYERAGDSVPFEDAIRELGLDGE